MIKGDWQKYANENIVENLVKKIEELWVVKHTTLSARPHNISQKNCN